MCPSGRAERLDSVAESRTRYPLHDTYPNPPHIASVLPAGSRVEWPQVLVKFYRNPNPGRTRRRSCRIALVWCQPESLQSIADWDYFPIKC